MLLLYGQPGFTLIVEALSRLFGRPLYLISFAELGPSVAELEKLSNVLSLVSHWGTLVLFDEGDALIEKRTSGQLELNSMTSILLHLMECFDGVLFITSNRVSSFDTTVLSRITLAIK